jgi:CrcB protein
VTALVFLGICVAGGIGAALRFVVDGAIRTRWATAFPFGTAVINTSGAFILGVLTGIVSSAVLLPYDWELVLGTGLMGGYTTFSTASIETIRLIENHEYKHAATNGLGVLVIAVAAGLLGVWLGVSAGR